MLLVSWNVAGLGTTVNRIHESFRSCVGNGKSSNDDVLTYFLQRHAVDILCVQEHKIPKQQLSNRCEPRGVSTISGYESFWSCCVDPTRKGFNGVVTFARVGTVRSADAAPLGVPDLDQQGRCVLTDHGGFLLFNVYVPASGGQPLAQKMRFLRALQRALRERRAQHQKPVILAGDMNIALAERDIYWKDRSINVRDVLGEVEASVTSLGEEVQSLPRWKHQLAEHWDTTINDALRTKEVIQAQTSNIHTKEKFDKFRLAVTLHDGKRIFLGKHGSSPECCHYNYDFKERSYWDDELQQRVLAEEGDVVRLHVLTELMQKIAGVDWSEAVQRQIASCAEVPHVSPARQWLRALLETDDMVDVFRYFYPSADSRFTCWNQFTNRRYVNDGARIDYIFVDRSILSFAKQGTDLRCSVSDNTQDTTSEAAALLAATGNGLFRPAAFEGGGIQEATQNALNTQFGTPHSGMIYTPPTFSDHIAISVLFEPDLLSQDLILNETDTATRKAQPHKYQKSIASFFGNAETSAAASRRKSSCRRTASGSSSTLVPSLKKTKVVTELPANSILRHFQRQSR